MKNALVIAALSLFALVAAGALVAGGFWLAPLLFPNVVETADLPSCDLQQSACQARFPSGGTVEVDLLPRPLRPFQPLELRVAVQGVSAEAVEIDFRGVSMNMGLNRPTLRRVSPTAFAGYGALPACYKNPMDWEARVLIHSQEGTRAAPFHFLVHN